MDVYKTSMKIATTNNSRKSILYRKIQSERVKRKEKKNDVFLLYELCLALKTEACMNRFTMYRNNDKVALKINNPEQQQKRQQK